MRQEKTKYSGECVTPPETICYINYQDQRADFGRESWFSAAGDQPPDLSMPFLLPDFE
jgi:hypothetical protein